MAKYVIRAQAPIGEQTIEATDFAIEGSFIVFTTPYNQNAVMKVYAIAIDKVFSIERQPD